MKPHQKICNTCKTLKPLSEFSKNKKTTDGLRYNCKVCMLSKNKDYYHTKLGLITRIYNNQKKHSQTYTKEELMDWVFSQKLFHELYDNWKASGFAKMLSPSCDRTDDYKGYSLDRLQLMTWQENKDKSHSDIRNGINNKNSIAVLQFNKNGIFIKEFYSTKQVERELNILHSSVSKACLGKVMTAGGFKWRYKEWV